MTPMSLMSTIKAGDTVFEVRRGDPHRIGSNDSGGTHKTVTKVGRDYFYVGSGWGQGKFRRENGCGAGDSAGLQAFVSEESYIATKAREVRWKALSSAIRWPGRQYWERMTDEELDQLTALIEILTDRKVEGSP